MSFVTSSENSVKSSFMSNISAKDEIDKTGNEVSNKTTDKIILNDFFTVFFITIPPYIYLTSNSFYNLKKQIQYEIQKS